MSSPIRVLLYEDNRDFRDGLSYLLRVTPGLELVAALPHCQQAQADVRQHQPHVVLMDISMPGRTGIVGAQAIKQVDSSITVLMLTMFDDDQHIWESVCAGASGYLLKSTSPAQIVDAVREAADGGAPMSAAVARRVLHMLATQGPPRRLLPVEGSTLTPREGEILELLVKGNSYKMIAAQLGVTIHTVRFHIQKVYQKLHVNSAPEAVARALQGGLTAGNAAEITR